MKYCAECGCAIRSSVERIDASQLVAFLHRAARVMGAIGVIAQLRARNPMWLIFVNAADHSPEMSICATKGAPAKAIARTSTA